MKTTSSCKKGEASPSPLLCAGLPSLILTLIFAFFSSASAGFLEKGDSLYAARAEGAKDNRADQKIIAEAIRQYQLAISDSASTTKIKEEAAWKLLRAYYFIGCFTMPKKRRSKKFI